MFIGVVNAMPWPLHPQNREIVPTAQEARWAPGPVWTSMESLTPHWDSIPGLSSP
jgi:hypothetical protein